LAPAIEMTGEGLQSYSCSFGFFLGALFILNYVLPCLYINFKLLKDQINMVTYHFVEPGDYTAYTEDYGWSSFGVAAGTLKPRSRALLPLAIWY
jgi:hypothetical protein